MVVGTQTINWGYEIGCLALGFGGIWYNYGYLNSPRAKASRYQPTAQLRAGGEVGSFFFIGCAIIIGAAPFVHHKISVLGIVGAVIEFIGALICLACIPALIMIAAGRIPKILSKTNEQ
jgi:hypothetical protein